MDRSSLGNAQAVTVGPIPFSLSVEICRREPALYSAQVKTVLPNRDRNARCLNVPLSMIRLRHPSLPRNYGVTVIAREVLRQQGRRDGAGRPRCGRRPSRPGRGAAFVTLLRRAGTHEAIAWPPALHSSKPLRGVLLLVRGTSKR